jgi:hypothetical protein
LGLGAYARRDFQSIENPNYIHEEMCHFKSLRGSIAMLIMLICQVSIVLPFNVSDLTLFDVVYDSKLNPFKERGWG